MPDTPDVDECRHMLDWVYSFHDNALSSDEMDDVRMHLLACEPCLDHYEVEEALRVLIRRGCREQAPDELRVRVRESLTVRYA